MHLSELTLKRFRSCDGLIVPFQKDLTVLVGENNGGKSNIIDALRLLTLPSTGRRERYPDDEDVRKGASEQSFEIVGDFRGLSPTQKGVLVSAVPNQLDDLARFGFGYEASRTGRRGKSRQWAGKFASGEPETGSTDLIRHVYLPPLRDAHQALGSGSGARVMALFRHFISKEEEPGFLDKVKRGNEGQNFLEPINAQVGEALAALTSGVRAQQAALGFVSDTIGDVARSMKFKLADAKLDLDEIRSSGLGYANLLYMATIIVELTKARESDLTLFLVEEPEAHLHPQLQMLVLDYLRRRAKESAMANVDPGQPEGRIQVIVTTHSPNLTANVKPERIVVVRPQSTSTPGQAYRTVVVPVAKLSIDPKHLKKIGRYLDVSRSSLLYGNRVVLIEGISEALLLPVLAEQRYMSDKDRLRRFTGSTIVSVEGVDFKPYLNLLLSEVDGTSIATRLIVLTDRDPHVLGNRPEELKALATALNADGKCTVLTNEVTLEHEIFTASNEATIRAAYLRVDEHGDSHWAADIASKPVAEKPTSFVALLKRRKLRKGDFAHALADCIEEGMTFDWPAYLTTAVDKVSENVD